MKTRLLNRWERLRSSYWFMPTLMALGAMILAFAAVRLDERLSGRWPQEFSWLTPFEAEGARSFLSTIAGATITVTGVVFSITIVALSLASQQFGPRLLNNFMRDRTNQFAFGVFIATYLYCLLALATIRSGAQAGFTPQISALAGFFLALFSVAVLIYFIHHVALSIQAMTIIDQVSRELQSSIDRQFPDAAFSRATAWRDEAEREEMPGDFTGKATTVEAAGHGYLQAIDEDGLLELAKKHDLILYLEKYPGQFLIPGDMMMRVWPKERIAQKDLAPRIEAAFILGPRRSSEQDMEYLVYQLVEVALRALSPGVNDPFTAITCIDHLGAALSRLATRAEPSRCRYDDQKQLRLVRRPVTFAGVVDACFDQIRQSGRDNAAVTIRLLEMIAMVIAQTYREEQRQPLLRQAAMIERGGREALPVEEDREIVHQRYLDIFRTIEQRFGLTGQTR